MTTVVITNTVKHTVAPRKPDDTVEKLDEKQWFDAYSKKIVILEIS